MRQGAGYARPLPHKSVEMAIAMKTINKSIYMTHKIRLLDLELDSISEKDLIQEIITSIKSGKGGWVLTPNVDILRKYHTDQSLHKYFSQATYLPPDGTPLIWAGQLQGTPFRGKMSGSSLIYSLTEQLAKERSKILLLGGNPGTGEKAKAVLASRYPGINIGEPVCPPFGFEHQPEYLSSLRSIVAREQPDFVYICLPFPKGELVIEYLKESFPKLWFHNFGVSLSYVTGEIRQAPKWLNLIGGEWIFHLIQEPNRLFKRYIIDGIPFGMKLLLHSIFKRLAM